MNKVEKKFACALCGSFKHKILRAKIRFGIERPVLICLSCGLQFLKSVPQSLRDFYKGDYRKKYTPVLGRSVSSKEMFDIYFPYQEARINDFRHLLNKKTKLLDVGCSSGAFLAAVKPYVKSVVGNEFNTKDASFVRKTLKIPVYTSPLGENPIKAPSFDLITAFQVLEHIDKPVEFLRTIGKYLKKNGRIIIEVPNVNDWLISVFDTPSYRDFYYREVHLFYYTPQTLLKMMKKAGFEGKVISSGLNSNFINQLNWILSGKPQENAHMMYGKNVLHFGKMAPPKLKRDIALWFGKIDDEYKKLVARNLIGRSITFIGKLSNDK